jgi:3-oxoadipate enol-lactonase
MHVAIDGATIHYRVEGRTGAPWVTLCNSLAANLRMWDFQAAALTGRYRVLRYDRRGHGESSAGGRDFRIERLARDVLALWDHLGIVRSHYVGCSIGGMTGLALARDHADRLGRFVCADARADAPPGTAAIWDERVKQARDQGMAAMVEPTLARWFTAGFRLWNPPVLDIVREMIAATSLDGYEGCARAVVHLDLAASLNRLAVPTLFVVGAEDASTTPAVARAMHASAPGSAYREIAYGAHLCNLEQPDAFNRLMIDFLAPS